MTIKMARLTVREASKYLGLAVSTLNQMRGAGNGPRFLKLGGKILYDTRHLDQWMDDNTRTSTSDDPQARSRRRPRRRRSRHAFDVIS